MTIRTIQPNSYLVQNYLEETLLPIIVTATAERNFDLYAVTTEQLAAFEVNGLFNDCDRASRSSTRHEIHAAFCAARWHIVIVNASTEALTVSVNVKKAGRTAVSCRGARRCSTVHHARKHVHPSTSTA